MPLSVNKELLPARLGGTLSATPLLIEAKPSAVTWLPPQCCGKERGESMFMERPSNNKIR